MQNDKWKMGYCTDARSCFAKDDKTSECHVLRECYPSGVKCPFRKSTSRYFADKERAERGRSYYA